MKRNTILTWACLTISLLVSCASATTKTSDGGVVAVGPSAVQSNPQMGISACPVGVEPAFPAEAADYVVSVHNYSERSISIDYPQISGLSDTAVENVVNDKLKAIFVANFLNNWVWEGLSVEATYEVTLKQPQYFSALCLSEPYVAGTIHPSTFHFGVTIDLHTGNLVCIEDVITVKQFRECISEGSYEVEPSSLTEVLSFDGLKNLPQFTSIVTSDNFNYNSFYLTETSICYLEGISHAYGDVATVVLPRPGA